MKKRDFKLSPTQLVTYDFCPRKYYYRYIRGIKEPASPHLVRGKIFHKVIEIFFGSVDIMEKDFERRGIKEWKVQAESFEKLFFSILNGEWKKIGKISEYEDVFKSEEEKKKFYEETKEFLEFYSYKIAFSLMKKKDELDPGSKYYDLEIKRHFYPKHREQFLEDDDMMGYIDKVIGLFGDGVAIIDVKTSKSRLPSFINRGHLLQLKSYAYMWFKKKNVIPKFVGIEYVRTGNTVFYPLKKSDLDDVEKIITELKNNRGKGVTCFPKKEGKLCGWCFFNKFCNPVKK